MRGAVLLGLLALAPLPLPAQYRSGSGGTWLDLGLGGGNTGLNGLLAITRRSGIHGLTVRGMAAAQVRLVLFKKQDTRSFGDLGLMYGVHGHSGGTLFAARAGLGAVWYHLESSDSGRSTRVSAEFGVPWELAVTRVFGNNVGLGVRLAGNANRFHNNIAGLLVLHIGDAW